MSGVQYERKKPHPKVKILKCPQFKVSNTEHGLPTVMMDTPATLQKCPASSPLTVGASLHLVLRAYPPTLGSSPEQEVARYELSESWLAAPWATTFAPLKNASSARHAHNLDNEFLSFHTLSAHTVPLHGSASSCSPSDYNIATETSAHVMHREQEHCKKTLGRESYKHYNASLTSSHLLAEKVSSPCTSSWSLDNVKNRELHTINQPAIACYAHFLLTSFPCSHISHFTISHSCFRPTQASEMLKKVYKLNWSWENRCGKALHG